MGFVYHAIDPHIGRPVALKAINWERCASNIRSGWPVHSANARWLLTSVEARSQALAG